MTTTSNFPEGYVLRNVLIFLPFSLCAAATLLLATPAILATSDSSSGGMIALIVTTIVGFLTMIAQQIFATQKATREHQWEVDARRELVTKTVDEAKILRDTITDKVDELTGTHAEALGHSIEVAAGAAIDASAEATKTNRTLDELHHQNQELLLRMERYEHMLHDKLNKAGQ